MTEAELDPNGVVVYLAISILCSKRSALFPELFYLMSPTQIVQFIKSFSGETIKVPTRKEFRHDILTALACFHVDIEGKSFDWFKIKYGLEGNTLIAIRTRLERWKSQLSDGEAEFLTLRRKGGPG